MSKKKHRNPWPRVRTQPQSSHESGAWRFAAQRPGAAEKPAGPTLREVMSDPSLKRWKRLLTKVEKDPDSALEEPRCLKPYFLTLFFDLCDGKALEAPYVAQDYVDVAVELAARTGEKHQMNLAAGLAVHAHIANQQWQEAFEQLKSYWRQVAACCHVCASDWLRRFGDLMVEAGNPRMAYSFLELSARALGSGLDHDMRGRILFVRGISHLYIGYRDRALDDAGEALTLILLDSPRGYFLDGVAFLACFLERGNKRRHDKKALKHLSRFNRRLKDLKGWQEVRDRIRWVAGLIRARLGNRHRARGYLERARKGHVQRAPHRWALAIGVDHALTYCRGRDPEAYLDQILEIMESCRDELKLEPELAERLAKFFSGVKQNPWRVHELLEELRKSYIVPVPGLLVRPEPPAA